MILRIPLLTAIVLFHLLVSPLFALTAEDAYQAGSTFYQQGKWDFCISQCREAVRLDPDQWQAYQVMGYAYFKNGDPAAALDACRISLQVHPDNPTLAVFIKTQLLTHEATDSGDEAYQEGLAFYKSGQWDQGIERFRESIRENPNAWLSYQQMGYAYAEQGDFGTAYDACRISLQIHPDNPALSQYTQTDLRSKVMALAPLEATNPSPETSADNSKAQDNRLEKRFGIYLGLLSDPFLSFGSLNLAYNITDFLRVNGGFGTASATTTTSYSISSTTASSFGLGIKALVPRWEFSPVFGVNLSEMSFNYGFSGLFTVSGAPSSVNLLFFYPNFGFDYQAKDGFDLGFGFNIPIIINSNVATAIPLLFVPALNIGKFF